MEQPHVRRKLLWVASWYPHPDDPFDGDFIQRHGEAVSAWHDVTILSVRRSKEAEPRKWVKRSKIEKNGLTEIRLVYGLSSGRFGLLDRAASEMTFDRVLRGAIDQYVAEEGKPHLIHLHVNGRPGKSVCRAARRLGIPLFISEHWSAFLPEGQPAFSTLPPYRRYWIRRAWKQAAGLSAVSGHLALQIEKTAGKNCAVIPNVVNTEIFRPQPAEPQEITRLVHISGLDDNKNWGHIFQAVAEAGKLGARVHLQIFGPASPVHRAEAERLGVGGRVTFEGEQSQPVLARALGAAHGLILYSGYETFGCVLIEALACGTPVLVSPLPAFREIVEEGVNGIIVPPEDPMALASAILGLMAFHGRSDRKEIARRAAADFGYDRVGRLFHEWYRTASGR